jgi:hypothetical protein
VSYQILSNYISVCPTLLFGDMYEIGKNMLKLSGMIFTVISITLVYTVIISPQNSVSCFNP